MMRILIMIFIATFVGNLSGQDVWSLQRCITYGLDHNTDLEGMSISQEEAGISESLARQARYPSLSGSIGLSTNFGRTIDPVSNQFVNNTFLSNSTGLNTSVSLYNAGRLKNAIKQAKIASNRVNKEVEQLKNDIALRIAQNYMNALLAKENLEIIKLQNKNLETQYTNLKKSVEIGNKAPSQLAELESQIATGEQNMVSATNNANNTLLTLKQTMRYPLAKELAIESKAEIPLSTDPDLVDGDELYSFAATHQYSILAVQDAVKESALAVAIAKSSLMPSVNIGGSIGTNFSNKSRKVTGTTQSVVEQRAFLNGNAVKLGFPQSIPQYANKSFFEQYRDNLSYGLGLQVAIPIYSNGQNRASIQRARLQEKRAQLNLANTKDKLYVTIQRAIQDARAAKRKYAASQKSKEAARVVFENNKKRYEIGAVDTYRYLDAQSRYQQSQLNEVISKYEYIFAVKVLDFYAGKPIF